MNPALNDGQVSILHSVHDGDDPVMRAPDAHLIHVARDVQFLVELGLIHRDDKTLEITPFAMDVLKTLHGRHTGTR